MTPEERARMEKALIAADAAGDAEGATVLAGALRASAPPPTPPSTAEQRAREMFGMEKYAKRGMVLPYGITESGETEFALPQPAVDMLTSFVLPGHVARGGDFTAQDVAKFTLDYGVPATQRARFVSGGQHPTKKQFLSGAPSTDDLARRSGDFYTTAEGQPITVKPASYTSFMDGLEGKLTRAGFDEDLHPSIAHTLKVWRKNEGMPKDVQSLNIARQQAKDALASNEPGIRRLGHMMQDELDDYVEKLSAKDLFAGTDDEAKKAADALGKARDLWSRSRKSQMLEEMMERAELQASGLENGIRIEMRALLKNPKKLRGFTDEEQDLMRDFVKGSSPQKLLRLLGKFSLVRSDAGNMFGGTVGAGAGATIGGAIAGPPGAVVGATIPPAVGYAGQKMAERAAVSKLLAARALAARGGKSPPIQADHSTMARLLALGLGPMLGAGALQNDQWY